MLASGPGVAFSSPGADTAEPGVVIAPPAPTMCPVRAWDRWVGGSTDWQSALSAPGLVFAPEPGTSAG
jgi:hypothetical protein